MSQLLPTVAWFGPQATMVPHAIVGDPDGTAEGSPTPAGPLPPIAGPADPTTLEGLAQTNRQLQSENVSLRAAIRQSNQALRERCGELQEFQSRNRLEREFVTRRFAEARRVVECLRETNSQLSLRAGAVKVTEPLEEALDSSLSPEPTLTQSMFTEEHTCAQNKTDQQKEESQEITTQHHDKQELWECHSEKLEEMKQRMKTLEAEFTVKIQSLSRQIEQLSEDKNTLKSQATSLLAELTESQATVESFTQRNTTLEERLRVLGERLRQREREAEEQRKQSSVAVDQLRIAVQNAESALKTERQSKTEDRRKLAQLQAAYHQLFAEYDHTMKERNKGQSADVMEQLREAESALALKQELIDKLKEDGERLRGQLETIPVLKAQAEVFEADFLAERLAREKLHEQREALQERVDALQREFERLRGEQEGAARAHFEEMQRRHSETHRTSLGNQANYYPNGSTVPFSANEPQPRPHFPDDLPDYRCPKCQYRAPDMDTLQIHVMDCIQ